MQSYQEIFYSITCVGFLNGEPSIHQTPNGEEQVEFFLKTILHKNALHRVFVNINDADKLLARGYSGAKLFLEGELINYSITTLNDEIQIIPEVFARKIWFLDPEEPKQCSRDNTNLQKCFVKSEAKIKKLSHYTLH